MNISILKNNIECEMHKFIKYSQKENENICEYHMRLQNLAENCEFHDKNIEIKMQIIQRCKSNKLRINSAAKYGLFCGNSKKKLQVQKEKQFLTKSVYAVGIPGPTKIDVPPLVKSVTK